ncbi:MAG: cytochrome c biogenesis protein CcsA [Myxococcota bacterium]
MESQIAGTDMAAGSALQDRMDVILRRVRNVTLPLAGLGLLAAMMAIAIYAPVEKTQGIVQKIFYMHVSSAWSSYLSFFICFASSILYLWKRDRAWDLLALAGAEVGVIFCTAVLVSGPFWGKPIWGAWWTWDARLTTTLVLWLIFLGYLLLRPFAGEGERGARFAAVLAIVGFLDIPLVHLSVRWWRTLHPDPVVMNREGPQLPPEMLQTLFLTLGAFTLLAVSFIAIRAEIERMRDLATLMRRRVTSEK